MFNFNGKEVPDFIKISSVDIQALPTVNIDTYSNSNSIGVVAGKTKLGAKTIKAKFTAVIPKGESLASCGRKLASWLQGDNFRESDLIINDDKGIKYRAKINNSVELSDCLYAGAGELEFLVASGVGQEVKETVATGSNQVAVNYSGTAPTFPIIELSPTQLINTEFNIHNSLTGETIYLTGNLNKGDTLEINNSKNLVKINGNTHIETIGFKSEFIQLVSGAQNIICSNPNINIKVKYNTAWI